MNPTTSIAHRLPQFAAPIVVTALLIGVAAQAAPGRSSRSRGVRAVPMATIEPGMDIRERLSVREGYRLAYQRIQQLPACAGLFSELEADGLSALSSTSYSSPLPGAERALCDRGALAVARAGHTKIRLCSSLWRLSKEGVAAILIHEALHSAGLGERPVDPEAPTSREITMAVLEACALR